MDGASTSQVELFDPALFPRGWELVAEDRTYTGERVERNRERYAAIVQQLGQGMGVRAICAAFGLDPRTLEVIRAREERAITTLKQEASRKAFQVARMCLESFEEDLHAGKVPPQVKPIAYGIFTEKGLLLTGEATGIFEHKRTEAAGANVEDLKRYIEGLPSCKAPVDKVLAVGAGIDLGKALEPGLQAVDGLPSKGTEASLAGGASDCGSEGKEAV